MFNLLIIDPQNDFCDPKGSLQVQGAEGDMMVLARFIQKHKNEISSITVSLDQHKPLQIFHPLFWINKGGEHPKPFTTITLQDAQNGVWTPINKVDSNIALQYLENLETRNKQTLTIWPLHCLIGSWGSSVYKHLSESLVSWSKYNHKNIDWILKGSDVYSEQYSALKAESRVAVFNDFILPDPAEPLYIAGEAFDFCVASTVKDIIDNWRTWDKKDITILEDCTSSIDKNNAEQIKKEFVSKGIKFAKVCDL